MNPTATALALRAYGLSEKLWGLQPTRIDAGEFLQDLEEHITEALAAERERCARVAEGIGEKHLQWSKMSLPVEPSPIIAKDRADVAKRIAAAIRARGS